MARNLVVTILNTPITAKSPFQALIRGIGESCLL
jgi:hypothetical protein